MRVMMLRKTLFQPRCLQLVRGFCSSSPKAESQVALVQQANSEKAQAAFKTI